MASLAPLSIDFALYIDNIHLFFSGSLANSSTNSLTGISTDSTSLIVYPLTAQFEWQVSSVKDEYFYQLISELTPISQNVNQGLQLKPNCTFDPWNWTVTCTVILGRATFHTDDLEGQGLLLCKECPGLTYWRIPAMLIAENGRTVSLEWHSPLNVGIAFGDGFLCGGCLGGRIQVSRFRGVYLDAERVKVTLPDRIVILPVVRPQKCSAVMAVVGRVALSYEELHGSKMTFHRISLDDNLMPIQ